MSITTYNSHSTTIIVDNSKYSKRMHCSTSLWWYCYDFSLQNGRMRWELCNPCLMYYVSYFFVIRDIFVGDVSSGVAWLAPRHSLLCDDSLQKQFSYRLYIHTQGMCEGNCWRRFSNFLHGKGFDFISLLELCNSEFYENICFYLWINHFSNKKL